MLKRGNYNESRLGRMAGSDFAPVLQADPERGMALIGVMLIMSLMLMLALAVTFTSLSDKSITSNFKNLTSGFYAAEAGVSNLHRLLRNDKFVMGSLPAPPRISVGQPTLNPSAFIKAAEQAFNTTESFPNNAAYKTKIKITDIQVPYSAGDNDPAHTGSRVKFVNPLYPRLGQVEPYSVSYQLESVGEGISGLNGAVTLVEEGVVNFNLLVKADGGTLRVGSFAEFALLPTSSIHTTRKVRSSIKGSARVTGLPAVFTQTSDSDSGLLPMAPTRRRFTVT